MGGEQQRLGGGAAHDADLLDASFDGPLGGLELQDHAATDDAPLHELLDFLAGDDGKNFFTIQHAGHIREINQLVGAEEFRARRGHVIGIDVIELVVGTDAETGRHGQQSFAPQRLYERQIQPGQIADIAQAAFHLVVHHRLGEEAPRIRSGDSDGRLAFGGNRRRKSFVQQARKNHDGGVARLAVRNAQTADELAFDGHALERGGEELGAAVHHQDFVPLLRQCGHLAGQAAHGRVVFEQCSREFDYGSH